MLALCLLLAVGATACQPNYNPCAPPDATVTALPPAGTALSSFYPALLIAVKDIKPPPEPHMLGKQPRERSDSDNHFCCIDGTTCLSLPEFHIPFCYDRFTTNFIFADGSDGTLDQGILRLAKGPRIDLNHGNYDGGGNIYGTDAPPNLATLPLPTPYTASGVDPAIPLSNLGGIATVTGDFANPGPAMTSKTMPQSTSANVIVEDGTTKTLPLTTSGIDSSSSTSSALAPEGNCAPGIGSKIMWGLLAVLLA